MDKIISFFAFPVLGNVTNKVTMMQHQPGKDTKGRTDGTAARTSDDDTRRDDGRTRQARAASE